MSIGQEKIYSVVKKPNLSDLNDKERENYVERLKDVIEHGFYMNKGKKEIWDHKKGKFSMSATRICFTEIKLSLARKHAERYGLLGIGVDRNFVLERYGNPVFYQYNGKFNCIAEQLRLLGNYLKSRDKEEKRNGDSWLKKLEVILAYCKNMNDQNKENLVYYDELEWRIVSLNILEIEKKTKRDEKDNSVFRVILKLEDIRVIVFPDKETRDIALSDEFIWNRSKHWIITMLDDCEHF